MTTIAETTVTSPRICVATKTAQVAGDVVQVMPITDVFLSGCIAMARTIAEMELTNSTKTVLLARKRAISDAKIEDAFQSKKCKN